MCNWLDMLGIFDRMFGSDLCIFFWKGGGEVIIIYLFMYYLEN